MRIRGSNAGYTMFRGSVKSTGYPLHLHKEKNARSIQRVSRIIFSGFRLFQLTNGTMRSHLAKLPNHVTLKGGYRSRRFSQACHFIPSAPLRGMRKSYFVTLLSKFGVGNTH